MWLFIKHIGSNTQWCILHAHFLEKEGNYLKPQQQILTFKLSGTVCGLESGSRHGNRRQLFETSATDSNLQTLWNCVWAWVRLHSMAPDTWPCPELTSGYPKFLLHKSRQISSPDHEHQFYKPVNMCGRMVRTFGAGSKDPESLSYPITYLHMCSPVQFNWVIKGWVVYSCTCDSCTVLWSFEKIRGISPASNSDWSRNHWLGHQPSADYQRIETTYLRRYKFCLNEISKSSNSRVDVLCEWEK
jgi:hypothetical protein